MVGFLVACILLGFLFVPILFIVKGVSDSVNSEKIDCPKCGKNFKLIRGSSECTKCRTRVTKTKEGELTI